MNRLSSLAAMLLAGLLITPSAWALQSALSGQVRQFDKHQHFEERPFDKNDYGYGLAYEIRDTKGFWQLGGIYTPDAGPRNTLDYALTPFLNMIIKHNMFLAGFGVDKTYMSGSDVDDDWTDLYWNILAGLEFPISRRLSLSGLAVYDFERWGKIDEFRFDDVEFAAALNLIF